jgi:predicted transposase/invertase (TIGR01784 family)
MCKKVEANREYKDNVFRLLFGDEEKSAELYSAISGKDYKSDMIKMNTIQNPFFYGVLRNDLSFTVENKLIILLEHQASLNPNMGLRFLLYLADLYEISIDKKAMYKSTPMTIANPEFYVIYNGKEKYPDKAVVKLSDLFEIQGIENNLELMVTIYNANKGYNKEIMERSKTLDEYAEFVAKVREYTDNSGLELTEALKKAVEDCVRNNILSEFLEKYGGDVVNILSREFNMDDFIQVKEEEKAEKIAENLIKRGTPLEFIVEDTGLSLEKVKKMAEKYNKNRKK